MDLVQQLFLRQLAGPLHGGKQRSYATTERSASPLLRQQYVQSFHLHSSKAKDKEKEKEESEADEEEDEERPKKRSHSALNEEAEEAEEEEEEMVDNGRRRRSMRQRPFVRCIGEEVALVRRLAVARTLEGHEGCVNSVLWSANGDKLVSGSDDCQLNIWNGYSGELLHSASPGHRANIFCAMFRPHSGDAEVVSCAADGLVLHSDVTRSNGDVLLRSFTSHESMVNKVLMQDTAPSLVYSCGEDGTVQRHDLRSGSNSDSSVVIDLSDGDTDLHPSPSSLESTLGINTMSPHPFMPYLAVGGGDAYVRIYDLRSSQSPIKRYHPSAKAETKKIERRKRENSDEDHHTMTMRYIERPLHITSLRYDSTGSHILVSYNGDNIYLLECEEECTDEKEAVTSYVQKFSGHLNLKTVKEVNFLGSSESFVVSGSDDGFVYIWDRFSGQLVHFFRGDGDVVNCVQGHPLGYPILACSGIDDTIKLFEPLRSEGRSLQPAVARMEVNRKKLSQSTSSSTFNLSSVAQLVERLQQEGVELHTILDRLIGDAIVGVDTFGDSDSDSDFSEVDADEEEEEEQQQHEQGEQEVEGDEEEEQQLQEEEDEQEQEQEREEEEEEEEEEEDEQVKVRRRLPDEEDCCIS